MNKKTGIILSYTLFKEEHKNFKVLLTNGTFENYFIYKRTKVLDNSYESIEPFNIVEFFSDKRKNVSNVSVIKIFPSINKDYKRYILISIFVELLQYSKVNSNDYMLYKIVYSFINNLNNQIHIHYENYLIFIFSYVALNTGYFNLVGVCGKCGKKLLNDAVYFSLNDYQERCVIHKIPYSFKIDKEYFKYYNLLKENIENKLIIPKLNKESNKAMIKFFINFYNILFEGKRIKTFKFLKYFDYK